MGYGYSDDRKASVRFSSSKTNGFVSQGVRGEISHKSYRIQSTHNFQESHHMCLHFFCVCNNLRLQIICTKIASLNKSNLVVFVFLHSLCDSNELWHFHLNLNLRCVCMCVCVLLSKAVSDLWPSVPYCESSFVFYPYWWHILLVLSFQTALGSCVQVVRRLGPGSVRGQRAPAEGQC